MDKISFKNIKIDITAKSVVIKIDSERIVFENSYLLDSFTDSHGHLLALGKQLTELDLSNCKSLEKCLEKIANHKSRKGDWIVGRGWNNELWSDNNLPHRKHLDEIAPDTPILLIRVDGHCAWVNSEAIRIADLKNLIDENNEDAKIDVDLDGNPTGIIYDYAIDYVKKFIPEYSIDDKKEIILKGCYELLRNGITTIHDMDVHPTLIPVFKELDDSGELPIRVFSFVSGNKNEWVEHNVKPYFGRNFFVIGVKFYADGSLGSRTAALLDDYQDDIGNKGLFLNNSENLFEQCEIALKSGFQVATHAIGDAANRIVLGVYSKLYNEGVADEKSMLRLEHAQHIHPDDLKFFKKYPIIASVQPIHCVSDAATISEKRLGERCIYAYPWRSLLKNNAVILAGSDFPIESCNPFKGITSFLHRIPIGSKKAWYPEECLSLDEAIKSYVTTPKELYNDFYDNNFNSYNGKIIVDNPMEVLNDNGEINVQAVIFNGKFFKFD